jgi:anti-sigma-K factor RskA
MSDSTADPLRGEPDADLLAAEYALGTLDAASRAIAERRMQDEPGFASEVAFWQARLGPLADDVDPVAPPAALWRRIEAAVVRLRPVAAPAAVGPRRSGLWHSLPLWRGLGIGGLGLAAASLAGLSVALRQPPPMPPMVASLAPEGGQSLFLAAFDRRSGRLMVMPAELRADQQRVPELWLLPAGGSPQSLGVFDPSRPMSRPMPPPMAAHLGPGAALAVTLEPPGGAPGGKPTGPIVASGHLIEL